MQEILEKRSLNSKHFLNDDGSITAEINLAPIHYINDSNEYDDIDLTIIPEKVWEFEYSVRKNNFHAYFNDVTDIDNYTLASFEIKNKNGVFRWINYKLYGATPTGSSIEENRIKYTDVFENIDLEYIVNPDKLKENIILKQPVSDFSYTFTLKISEGLKLEQRPDGSIWFIDIDTEEVLWTIDKPYAQDNNESKTENVTYTLGKQTYQDVEYDSITVTINDSEFLNSAVYPITIDPTTINYQISKGGNDGYEYYNTSYTFDNSDTSLILGKNGSYSYNSFICFENVAIPKGANIQSSYIGLNAKATNSGVTAYNIISGNNVDSAVAPTGYTAYNNLALTTAKVNWNIFQTTINTWVYSQDISSIIKEIVSRAGWLSGNSIQFLIKRDTDYSGGSYVFNSYNGSAASAPKLSITYSTSSPPTDPGAFTSPSGTLSSDTNITISWGASTDVDGDLTGYKLSYAVDGGAFGAEIDCVGNSYNMTTPKNSSIQFRVRAYDGTGSYSGYSTSPVYTITTITKIQIGAYKLIGKKGIISIPIYDPNVCMDGKNMLRTFLKNGKVGCFELQDLVGTELIRIIGKTKVKGIKI